MVLLGFYVPCAHCFGHFESSPKQQTIWVASADLTGCPFSRIKQATAGACRSLLVLFSCSYSMLYLPIMTQRGSSDISLCRILAALSPERPGTHRTGGWVGPRAGLDGCGKSRLLPGFDPQTVQPLDISVPGYTCTCCPYVRVGGGRGQTKNGQDKCWLWSVWAQVWTRNPDRDVRWRQVTFEIGNRRKFWGSKVE
jgi:hypothetical protein